MSEWVDLDALITDLTAAEVDALIDILQRMTPALRAAADDTNGRGVAVLMSLADSVQAATHRRLRADIDAAVHDGIARLLGDDYATDAPAPRAVDVWQTRTADRSNLPSGGDTPAPPSGTAPAGSPSLTDSGQAPPPTQTGLMRHLWRSVRHLWR